MEKRIQVSIRYKGKHFIIGDEFKTEEYDGSLTLGQFIGNYIHDQLDYLEARESDGDSGE